MDSFGDGATLNLAKYRNETELQKMLADEKMRSEQHKMNYQDIKLQYSRLLDDYASLQQAMQRSMEENQMVKTKYQQLYEDSKMSIENASHSQNANQEKQQTKNPSNEKSLHERLAALEHEKEMCTEEINRLRFDYSFAKSEYEQLKNEYQSVVRELKMRHEAEISNLRSERNETISRIEIEHESESKHSKQIHKENIQLNIKVKSLLSELDEIRSQREHQGMQMDNVARLQNKHYTDSQTIIKSMESEKECLNMKLESYHKEIQTLRDENHRSVTRCYELEKHNQNLNNKLEEITHRYKLEISELKLNAMKANTEWEKNRIRMLAEIANLAADIDVYKSEVKRAEDAKLEVEREHSRKLQEVLEEEWNKQHVIENERLRLENMVESLERNKKLIETEWSARLEKMESQLQQSEEVLAAADKEANLAKSRLQNQQNLMDDLQHEKMQLNSFKQQLKQVENLLEETEQKYKSLKQDHEECEGQKQQLMQNIVQLKLDLAVDVQKMEDRVGQDRCDWLNGKEEMQSRIDQLQKMLADVQAKNCSLVNSYKQKKSQMKSINYKLKDKLYTIKMELHTLKNDSQNKADNDQSDVKKHLRDLLRKNNQFRALLAAAPSGMSTDMDVILTKIRECEQKQQEQLIDFQQPKSVLIKNYNMETFSEEIVSP